MNPILAAAYRRAKIARRTPKTIAIADFTKIVPIPVTRSVEPAKIEPPVEVPKFPNWLGAKTKSLQPTYPTIKTILETVSDYYSIPIIYIYSRRRQKIFTRPRQIAMYLAHILTPQSYPMIARHIGGRDHTTVIHGIRKIKQLLPHDAKIAFAIEELKQKLGSGGPPPELSAPAATSPAVGATIQRDA